MEYQTCLEKQKDLSNEINAFPSSEGKYRRVIEIGRSAPPFPKEKKLEENLVKGCQSLLYLHVELLNGKLSIQTGSDALISAGLAALLCTIYQGEPPEAVLKCPPHFLKETGLLNALSPSRANGLKSLYQSLTHRVLPMLLEGAK